MLKVDLSVMIKRPIEEVFAVMSDFENDPKWRSGIEVKKTSEGPIGVGTTYHSIVTALGRRIEGEVEFTEYESNRRCATKTKSGPIPVDAQWTFKRVDGGTQVDVTLEAEADGFFKLAEPLLVNILKRQFEADTANLKYLMEAHAL